MGKLLDVVILTKEEKHLLTSDLQFGLQKGWPTSMCTSMVHEPVSYYVYNGTMNMGYYWMQPRLSIDLLAVS